MNEPQLSAEMKRIKDSCQCKHCIDGVIHSSDCAVHNEPADKNGECDCEAVYISVFSEELSYYWNWWFGDGWTNDKDKYHLFLLVKKELATALEEQKQLSYEIGKRDATKKWHENEQAWVELNKQSVIKHKQELATARAEGAAEERTMIIEEIKQVCKVHRYLDDKTRDKVIRFIENLGKPQPEMALTTKEHHAS